MTWHHQSMARGNRSTLSSQDKSITRALKQHRCWRTCCVVCLRWWRAASDTRTFRSSDHTHTSLLIVAHATSSKHSDLYHNAYLLGQLDCGVICRWSCQVKGAQSESDPRPNHSNKERYCPIIIVINYILMHYFFSCWSSTIRLNMKCVMTALTRQLSILFLTSGTLIWHPMKSTALSCTLSAKDFKFASYTDSGLSFTNLVLLAIKKE